jgi:penicillin-insensitive murein endopeptidase
VVKNLLIKYISIIIITISQVACNSEYSSQPIPILKSVANLSSYSSTDSLKINSHYHLKRQNNGPSKSLGSVSNGSLENGIITPFFGTNFTYFDTSSYFCNRGFAHESVIEIIVNAYQKLSTILPDRHFYVMELSNEHGGKIFPHKTHQNGMSVDFMMPKLKHNEPFYGLDTLGKDHYWLDFDDSGIYTEDQNVKIDFNLVAQHILVLAQEAKKVGYKITKVIIKIEYKNHLFKTVYGKQLKNSNIYIVKSLTPVINKLHDDHFHIDFQKIEP